MCVCDVAIESPEPAALTSHDSRRLCGLMHHRQLGVPEARCVTPQATREEFAYHKGISRLERGFQVCTTSKRACMSVLS